MTPLHVAAFLEGQIVLPSGALALDALLMAAVAIRDNLPPVTVAAAEHGSLPVLEIPVARSACGRIYLASFATPRFDDHEIRYRNRRFPVVEALNLSGIKRVDTNAGPEKSYRIPRTASHVEGDRLDWWCVGDADGVRQLLALVQRVGRDRNVGRGRVREWIVEECEPWDGFPVVRDGAPTRPLPIDWPGVTDGAPGLAVLSPPYWDTTRREAAMVAV